MHTNNGFEIRSETYRLIQNDEFHFTEIKHCSDCNQLLSDDSRLFGYIYIIEAEGTNRVKIGRSTNIDKRLSQLCPQSPYPLKIVNSFFTYNTKADELFLHKAYQEFQVHGEWFELNKKHIEKLSYIFVESETANNIAFQITNFTIELINQVSFYEKYSSILYFPIIDNWFLQLNSIVKKFVYLYMQVNNNTNFENIEYLLVDVYINIEQMLQEVVQIYRHSELVFEDFFGLVFYYFNNHANTLEIDCEYNTAHRFFWPSFPPIL